MYEEGDGVPDLNVMLTTLMIILQKIENFKHKRNHALLIVIVDC